MIVAHRIVRTDSVGDDTVLVSKTQDTDGFIEGNLTSQLESSTLPEHQKRNDDNTSTIFENKLC